MDLSFVEKELNTNGYCVIPNVLNEEEVNLATEAFKEWQNSIPEHEYISKNLNSNGIYKFYIAGHTKHAWFIRTRPNVQNVFKTLWKTNELITSFDGCCYISKDSNKEDTCWIHSDQGPLRKGCQCYQSIVSLTENKEKTLVVYEGSHLLHESYFEERNIKSERNWQIIEPEYLSTIEDKRRVLHVPAGAMVVWDSRTFHQNQHGDLESGEERMVQYICFFPKNHPFNDEENQQVREFCFDHRITSTHWPAPLRYLPLQPSSFGYSDIYIDYETLPVPNVDEYYEEIEKIL